ncbi:hypothetical protein PS2015_1069 [Pseudohongiella spirulinae]|uniref:Uncharacterized protein n=1 Tax=Pseudohongiella spirulinae TaxID=1249552 RepID=A0A0S2KC32_9GAMM|nr:hypothetical protein PS2015_1069 [Pseudohongiella spirulinae]
MNFRLKASYFILSLSTLAGARMAEADAVQQE